MIEITCNDCGESIILVAGPEDECPCCGSKNIKTKRK